MKNSETQLFTESHTRDILTGEKREMFDRSMDIRQNNQEKGREITRMRYHNNKDELMKKRKDGIDDTKLATDETVKVIEQKQNCLEAWLDRNNDDHGVLKR